ncbi:MAG: cation transporter [Oscillospiraceae bacterium]|nr:cation transporter [Oscillospiraceae bacterium]
MKKTFKLEGLDCAHCASKIETAIKKLGGVNSASVNFMTTKMTIDAEDGRFDDIVKAATAIVKKIEPDVVMKNA